MSRSFFLFDNTLVIEDSRLLAIDLRRIVMILASTARKSFEEYYPQFSNIEGLLKEGKDTALSILATSSKNCVDALSKLDIYSISAEDILENMKGSYYMGELEELENWYLSVLQNEAEKDAYRTARRKNRSKWVGYGFGIQGAITSAAKAGTLNMLSGAAHGTVNLVGKSFSMMGASMNKSQMFHSKDTRNRLASALYLDIFDWIYSLQRLVQQGGIQIQEITLSDEKRANSLFQNLKSGSLNQKQAYSAAFQLFETDPAEMEYYEFCALHFPEQQKVLLELLEYCCGDSGPLAEKILNSIVDSLPHRTEDETLKLYQKLKEKQAELGIANSITIEEIEQALQKFDITARTFRKMIFETREGKKKAEDAYNSLLDLCGKADKANKEMCTQTLDRIISDYDMPVIQEYFQSEIEKSIKSMEQKEAKATYDALYNSYSESMPELSKYKTKKEIFTVLGVLCNGIGILFFTFSILALLEFALPLVLLFIGMVVLFAALSVRIGDKKKEIENATESVMPPDLIEAYKKFKTASQKYEEEESHYTQVSKRFSKEKDIGFVYVDSSGRITKNINLSTLSVLEASNNNKETSSIPEKDSPQTDAELESK